MILESIRVKNKKIFGNKIRGIEYYDVVEEAGHWSFKIGFLLMIIFTLFSLMNLIL